MASSYFLILSACRIIFITFTTTLSLPEDGPALPKMLDQAMELLRRLIGILVAILDLAYTLVYYAYATIIYSTGAVLLLLCWCAFCALTQSVAEHVPIKRWIDRRLQDKFLRKVKNMSYEELNMRARLINVGEDVKIRNEANNRTLKEICDAENFSKYSFSSNMYLGLSSLFSNWHCGRKLSKFIILSDFIATLNCRH